MDPVERSANKSHPNFDLSWETYMIPDGLRLRFTTPGRQDAFMDVPENPYNRNILVPVLSRQNSFLARGLERHNGY